jgi:hypothetical protein
MHTWKVILDLNGKTIEFFIKAKTYNEAYINAELSYPDGRIRSLKISEDDTEQSTDLTNKN